MNDLYQSAVARNDFQRWLDLGYGPFTIWRGEQPLVTLFKLEKRSEVDYLYKISHNKETGISWDNNPLSCGVYDTKNRMLYLTEDILTIFMDGKYPLIEGASPSITREISGKVNQRVESLINNDRDNLPVRELTSWPAQRELQEYQEFGAKEEALRQFFDDRVPDSQFHSGYAMGDLAEAAFIAYIQDPEGFIQTESALHIQNRQEAFLLQFLKNDVLLAEYQALVQATGSPLHKMKAITDAIDGCGAKMVNVTIQKAGVELTFKMEADRLKGYHNSYSTNHIPAADRRKFEQMFGPHTDYTAEDIVKITYGRNTIYEGAPVQAEEPVQSIGMGGMY